MLVSEEVILVAAITAEFPIEGAPGLIVWLLSTSAAVAFLAILLGNGLLPAVLRGLAQVRVRFKPLPYLDAERVVRASVSHRRTGGDTLQQASVVVSRSRAFVWLFNLRWYGSDRLHSPMQAIDSAVLKDGVQLTRGSPHPITIELRKEVEIPSRWPWQQRRIADPASLRLKLVVAFHNRRRPVARGVVKRTHAVPEPGNGEGFRPGYL